MKIAFGLMVAALAVAQDSASHFAAAKAAAPKTAAKAKSNNVLVPESILKKRRTLQAVKAKKAEAGVAARKHRAKVAQIAFKSAEKYVKEYRNIEKQNVFSAAKPCCW